MDSARFDGLARAFSQARLRRQTLCGLAALAASGALALSGRAVSAQACKGDGKACKKNSQCCSGNCGVGTGQGPLPGACAPACPASCPDCQTCSNGGCTPVDDNTPCGAAGSGLRCCNGACPSPTCLSLSVTDLACCADEADCGARCCTGRTALCSGCDSGLCCAGQNPGGGPCGRDADCPTDECLCPRDANGVGTCPPLN